MLRAGSTNDWSLPPGLLGDAVAPPTATWVAGSDAAGGGGVWSAVRGGDGDGGAWGEALAGNAGCWPAVALGTAVPLLPAADDCAPLATDDEGGDAVEAAATDGLWGVVFCVVGLTGINDAKSGAAPLAGVAPFSLDAFATADFPSGF